MERAPRLFGWVLVGSLLAAFVVAAPSPASAQWYVAEVGVRYRFAQ